MRRNAPIGPRPAHRIFTESPAFKRWFGRSVLVREDGDPLVLFHGTDKDFTVFEKVGTSSLRPLGFWFADDPDEVEAFGDRLMPVYLRVENPYYAELDPMREKAYEDKTWAARFRASLIEKGYDGIIIRPRMEQVGRFRLRDSMMVVVFDPRQVKSAIGNRGTYDPADPDILRNPPIDLAPYAVEPREHERKFYNALFNLSPTPAAERERNKEARTLLARHGYTLGRLLGAGTFASVYALTGMPDRVAKITNDPTDAAIMAEVMNAPDGIPGLPKVYGVYQLPRAYDRRKGYVIVVERLYSLSEKDRRTFREIADRYDLGWSISAGVMPARGTRHPMEVTLVNALLYLSSLGYLVGDVGPSNFMRRRDGSYVISDFGMSGVNVRQMPTSRDVPIINPVDLKGRSIPERYLAGLPRRLKDVRIRELTLSRDAYRQGDYSELPTDRLAREMGLVKKSAYSRVAEQRGIEWRGDAKDMAKRVCEHYGVSCTRAVAEAITQSYAKGLAAWKSGGHRPGATARNWAVARVNSLVVGGKTAFTADAKLFGSFPLALRKAIMSKSADVVAALRKQGRDADASIVRLRARP